MSGHGGEALPRRVILIAALDDDFGIGKDGDIPWHIPEDWERFKRLTMDHPMVVGRKTFEAIGKPLPGRTSVIATRRPDYHAPEGCLVTGSVGEALAAAGKLDDEVFVIGGGEIYAQALPSATDLWLTHVAGTHPADARFPRFGDEFEAVKEERHDDHDPAFRYVDYRRAGD